jgi:hypothetical protein
MGKEAIRPALFAKPFGSNHLPVLAIAGSSGLKHYGYVSSICLPGLLRATCSASPSDDWRRFDE